MDKTKKQSGEGGHTDAEESRESKEKEGPKETGPLERGGPRKELSPRPSKEEIAFRKWVYAYEGSGIIRQEKKEEGTVSSERRWWRNKIHDWGAK